MNRNIKKYEMWHDEYRDNQSGAFVHGILLLPEDRKKEILSFLRALRYEFIFTPSTKKGFSGSLRNEKSARFLRNQLSLGIHFLKVKPEASLLLINADGKMRYEKGYTPFLEVPGDDPYCAKLGLLVVHNNHADMFGHDYAAKVELTLRFALKGLCHWAFKNNPVKINNLYFDGSEHHHRDFYIDRIAGPQKWQPNVVFDPSEIQVDDRHRNQRTGDSALIMDLIDSMLGGLFNLLYADREDPYSGLVPLSGIKDRITVGELNKNNNSRWYKAAMVSEVCLTESNNFDFRPFSERINPYQETLGI